MEHTGGFLDPESILDQLEFRDNMLIADFGSGHGYFVLPLSRKTPEGKIYAVDVLQDALDSIKSKAEIEGISNIETVRGNLENENGSGLDENSLDRVFLANILFQSQKKQEILKEAKRVLKEEGELIIIDWLEGSSLAPKEGWLLSKESARNMAEEGGFTFDREMDMDGQHYGMIFKK